MTKTLGEVAKAARDAILYEHTTEQQRWEIVASAVAAEVRKQCIAACESILIADPCRGEEEAQNCGVDMCIAAIKDLT